MAILIFALIVLIITALLVWVVDYIPLGSPFNNIIKAIIVIVAVIVIANRAGVF